MINDEADEVIKEPFDSLKDRYKKKLKPMKGSQFVFDYVQLLYYKCHKITANHHRSNIDFPYWTKTKKEKSISSIKKIKYVLIRCNSSIKSWRFKIKS